MFLHILAYFFQLGYLEQNFKYRVLYFQVYVKIVEENRMYQLLQKICREKVCHIKLFGQIWENRAKYLLHPQ